MSLVLHEETKLGSLQQAVDAALQEMDADCIVDRIWKQEHTVWQSDPEEIVNRLGWLHVAETMQTHIPRLEAFAQDVRAASYTDALLLGMGGSSLAPEVFSRVFGDRVDGLSLAVLDSTVPGAVLHHARRIDPQRTLFIVASKSGSTAETMSFFKAFYNHTANALGAARAGEHFVAITDPGSRLIEMNEKYNFRDVFVNDPNIGGRYSALSFFGMLPAALLGLDLTRLLARARDMATACGPSTVAVDNPGAQLGAILGESARAGRDKATFVISDELISFGDWVEQLIAESVGKAGTGLLPVVREPLGPPSVYGNDRLFIHVHLRQANNSAYDSDADNEALNRLEAAGHPVVRLTLPDAYDLGGQMFLWEMATAVAGHRMGIHPFNQPNVEAAKKQARRMIEAYKQEGRLPESASTPVEARRLREFIARRPQAGAPSPHADRPYIALHAYLQPKEETNAALQALRIRLRDRYRMATTLGYGPRFLHSTGQLHKGDAGNGVFIQFTADDAEDAPIPDRAGDSTSTLSFSVLKMAQALGDRNALEEAGRRVMRFHLGGDVSGGIERLARL